jgi:hypothetical protein
MNISEIFWSADVTSQLKGLKVKVIDNFGVLCYLPDDLRVKIVLKTHKIVTLFYQKSSIIELEYAILVLISAVEELAIVDFVVSCLPRDQFQPKPLLLLVISDHRSHNVLVYQYYKDICEEVEAAYVQTFNIEVEMRLSPGDKLSEVELCDVRS